MRKLLSIMLNIFLYCAGYVSGYMAIRLLLRAF